MKKIHTPSNITEAHIIRGLLESNGIEAFVGGHYLQGGIGELPASDFAAIFVNDEDTEAALKIIQQYDHSNQASSPDNSNKADLWLKAPLIFVFVCILIAILSLINEH